MNTPCHIYNWETEQRNVFFKKNLIKLPVGGLHASRPNETRNWEEPGNIEHKGRLKKVSGWICRGGAGLELGSSYFFINRYERVVMKSEENFSVVVQIKDLDLSRLGEGKKVNMITVILEIMLAYLARVSGARYVTFKPRKNKTLVRFQFSLWRPLSEKGQNFQWGTNQCEEKKYYIATGYFHVSLRRSIFAFKKINYEFLVNWMEWLPVRWPLHQLHSFLGRLPK